MRYAQIRKMDISNGEGLGISLFVQGCHFHCDECFNPETWDFDGGELWTEDIEKYFFELADRTYVKRISILGGEPLDSYQEVYGLIKKLKSKFGDSKKIWLYTGYRFENIDTYILPYIDIVVDGQFDKDKKDLRLKHKGSSNQRVIDVQRSIEQNTIIKYEE